MDGGGGRSRKRVPPTALHVLLALLALVLPFAASMPDALGRPLWTETAGVSSGSPSPPPERLRLKEEALRKGAKRALARGRRAANALQLPQYWVRGDDPAHPKMRIPVDLEKANTVNVMPENCLWKDHDSDQDEGHPNWTVERLEDLDDEQLSEEMDRTMEEAGYDMRRWSDANYTATIKKYNLQDVENAKYLCPKLYYEPRGSSEEEEFAEMLLEQDTGRNQVPTTDEPFCMECESLLGAPIPSLGLDELAHDPRCRKCGFLNPHAPDGTLLTHGNVNMVEMEPSKLVLEQQQMIAEKYHAALDSLDEGQANLRPTTEQRCEECGWKIAYYWSAQVRGADEGRTAFFECVRCKNVWNIKS